MDNNYIGRRNQVMCNLITDICLDSDVRVDVSFGGTDLVVEEFRCGVRVVLPSDLMGKDYFDFINSGRKYIGNRISAKYDGHSIVLGALLRDVKYISSYLWMGVCGGILMGLALAGGARSLEELYSFYDMMGDDIDVVKLMSWGLVKSIVRDYGREFSCALWGDTGEIFYRCHVFGEDGLFDGKAMPITVVVDDNVDMERGKDMPITVVVDDNVDMERGKDMSMNEGEVVSNRGHVLFMDIVRSVCAGNGISVSFSRSETGFEVSGGGTGEVVLGVPDNFWSPGYVHFRGDATKYLRLRAQWDDGYALFLRAVLESTKSFCSAVLGGLSVGLALSNGVVLNKESLFSFYRAGVGTDLMLKLPWDFVLRFVKGYSDLLRCDVKGSFILFGSLRGKGLNPIKRREGSFSGGVQTNDVPVKLDGMPKRLLLRRGLWSGVLEELLGNIFVKDITFGVTFNIVCGQDKKESVLGVVLPTGDWRRGMGRLYSSMRKLLVTASLGHGRFAEFCSGLISHGDDGYEFVCMLGVAYAVLSGCWDLHGALRYLRGADADSVIKKIYLASLKSAYDVYFGGTVQSACEVASEVSEVSGVSEGSVVSGISGSEGTSEVDDTSEVAVLREKVEELSARCAKLERALLTVKSLVDIGLDA